MHLHYFSAFNLCFNVFNPFNSRERLFHPFCFRKHVVSVKTELLTVKYFFFSVSTRMNWSLSVLLASFLALLSISVPNSDVWQAKYLHVVLVVVVLTNVGVNVLQVKEI